MDKPLLASQQVGNRLRGRHLPGRRHRPPHGGHPGTVAGVTGARGRRNSAAREDTDPPLVTTGVASLAVRDVLRGPRRPGKVLAALPPAISLESPDLMAEPRVIAISAPDALRLPNAIVSGPWE